MLNFILDLLLGKEIETHTKEEIKGLARRIKQENRSRLNNLNIYLKDR